MHNSFVFIVVLISLVAVESFVPFHHEFRSARASVVSLAAAPGGKKKKQRRKQPPGGTPVNPATKVEVAPTPPVAKEPVAPVAKEVVAKAVVEEVTVDKVTIADIANFKFEPDNAITKGTYSCQLREIDCNMSLMSHAWSCSALL
jgi:hypothetical protein